jgi:hypothetical protein
MNWWNQLKAVFIAPSAEVLAQRELEDAKRQLLEALSQRDYQESMVVCHTKRVTRLQKVVRGD